MLINRLRDLRHVAVAAGAALVLLATSASPAAATPAPGVSGHRESIDVSSRYGDWIGDIERPPEQYRSRPPRA